MECLALRLDPGSFELLRGAALRALGEAEGGAGLAAKVVAAEGAWLLCGLELEPFRGPSWDPRPRLAALRARIASLPEVERISRIARLEALYRRRRPAEGIHGEGPFARRFAELRSSPGFPANLVGFGNGTTPAGDDFLAGCLLGRDLGLGVPGAAPLRLELSATSPPGRSLLLQALAGGFPAVYLGLAEALAGLPGGVDFGRGLEGAAEALFAHGASSGADALAGLLWSLGRLPRDLRP